MVEEFQEAFGDKCPKQPRLPKDLTPEARKLLREYSEHLKEMAATAHRDAQRLDRNTPLLRAQLMIEEVGELLEAIANGSLTEILHEGSDVRYVVDGTLLTFGLGHVYEKAVGEIHRANMSKLENGKPVKDGAGRVVKGRYFKKADVSTLLRKRGK